LCGPRIPASSPSSFRPTSTIGLIPASPFPSWSRYRACQAGAPIETSDGRLWTRIGDNTLTLLTFVDGRPLVGDDPGEQRLIGETLARALSSGLPVPSVTLGNGRPQPSVIAALPCLCGGVLLIRHSADGHPGLRWKSKQFRSEEGISTTHEGNWVLRLTAGSASAGRPPVGRSRVRRCAHGCCGANRRGE